jgi:hypothetical protein
VVRDAGGELAALRREVAELKKQNAALLDEKRQNAARRDAAARAHFEEVRVRGRKSGDARKRRNAPMADQVRNRAMELLVELTARMTKQGASARITRERLASAMFDDPVCQALRPPRKKTRTWRTFEREARQVIHLTRNKLV